MYLLDTDVVSELRKARMGRAAPTVVGWAAGAAVTSLHVSVITILELELGARLVARKDAVQATILQGWLEDHVLPAFADRILPVDLTVARRCSALHVPDPRPFQDSLIAATALVHDLTLVTRNVADFAPMGVRLLNPWS